MNATIIIVTRKRIIGTRLTIGSIGFTLDVNLSTTTTTSPIPKGQFAVEAEVFIYGASLPLEGSGFREVPCYGNISPTLSAVT